MLARAHHSKSEFEKRSDARAYRRARPDAERAAKALTRALRDGSSVRTVARCANDAVQAVGALWEAAARLTTK